jgi:hypothetical protein
MLLRLTSARITSVSEKEAIIMTKILTPVTRKKILTPVTRKNLYIVAKEKNESTAYIENIFGWESYKEAADDVLQDLKRQQQERKNPNKPKK